MKTLKLIIYGFRDLIIRYLPRMTKKGGFAFIVHPRTIPDVYRKYPFLKFLPIPILKWFLRHYWPAVISRVEGLKTPNGENIRGLIITIPLTAEQMLENRKLAFKKIIQAIRLAEKFGAQIIGLGAFIAGITNGGEDIIGYSRAYITSGNSLTAGVAASTIEKILENNLRKKMDIAIIGATTFIGEALSKMLVFKNNFNSLIIIGKTPSHLENLRREIKILNKSANIISTTKIDDIIKADLVVIATSSPSVKIDSNYLKKNAIVYDISQPTSISNDVKRERKDVKFIEGGLIHTPNINYHFNFGIPHETAFCCLAETMILAGENINKHYSLGKLELNQVNEIMKLTESYGFYPFIT